MSKYIIDVGDAYIRHGLERTLTIPVRINEHEDHWMDTRIPVTPYTEPDFEQIKKLSYAQGYSEGFANAGVNCHEGCSHVEEAYQRGYETAKHKCNIQAEKDLREVGERHYQKGLSDAWEAAGKIAISEESGGLTCREMQRIFCTDEIDEIFDMSASEAIEKIRQYEQEKEKSEEQKKQESITTEDVMRQYLDTFCKGRSCIGCPLHTPDFTCGRGKHFLHDRVSDEEVRRAYFAVLQKMKEES